MFIGKLCLHFFVSKLTMKSYRASTFTYVVFMFPLGPCSKRLASFSEILKLIV